MHPHPPKRLRSHLGRNLHPLRLRSTSQLTCRDGEFPLCRSKVEDDLLSDASPEFREAWAEHRLKDKTHGRYVYRHPVVGELDLGFETLRLPDDPDQALVAHRGGGFTLAHRATPAGGLGARLVLRPRSRRVVVVTVGCAVTSIRPLEARWLSLSVYAD
ncbi:hypothetical protein [Streptomyces sp. NPDC059649]|uniref:MmyB family transcriptional regulator n=1 Tax=Streptomyces sp. NPDC059649 TaxID=3346895 RepID=UPI0036A77B71